MRQDPLAGATSARPLHIAWVSQWFPPDLGALPARITEMSRLWAAMGHRVTVLTAFPHHPLGKIPRHYRGKLVTRERFEDLEVIRCWLLGLPNRRAWQRTVCQVSFAVSSLLLGAWRVRPPDVVIVSSPPFLSALGGVAAARLWGAPFVFEVRDLWPQALLASGSMRRGPAYRCLEVLERSFLRRSRRIVVVTRSFRADLISRGVPAAKIAVIPNGADPGLWRHGKVSDSLRAALGGRAEFIVGYVGTHGTATGLEVVLDAAALLRDQPQIAFAFVGEGSERERLVADAEQRGLTNVSFHHGVDKACVSDVYASLDACVVCLRPLQLFAQFIPSKIFEIMASAKPLIAALAGEAADIVREGGGIVVPPGDAAALAEAIRACSVDLASRRAAAERGRSLIESRYDRRQLAMQYLAELSTAVVSRRPS